MISNIFAYLDPGTGSLILQALVGVGAGVAYFGRSRWYKIKNFFSKKDKNSKTDKEE